MPKALPVRRWQSWQLQSDTDIGSPLHSTIRLWQQHDAVLIWALILLWILVPHNASHQRPAVGHVRLHALVIRLVHLSVVFVFLYSTLNRLLWKRHDRTYLSSMHQVLLIWSCIDRTRHLEIFGRLLGTKRILLGFQYLLLQQDEHITRWYSVHRAYYNSTFPLSLRHPFQYCNSLITPRISGHMAA